MRRLVALLMVAALIACAAPPPPPPSMSPAEQEEFRQDLLADMDKVDIFLQKTRRGINLTEITLGWFVMILLNELAAHDTALYAHILHDDGTAESYLRQDFQTDPTGEIAAIEALAAQDQADIRLVARDALTCLTTIPSPKTSAETQAEARVRLAAALAALKARLSRVAQELAPPPPALDPGI